MTTKVYKVISVAVLIAAAILLCISLFDVLTGGASEFRAWQLTYNSEDVAEVAHAHSYMLIQSLSVIVSEVAMLATGVIGVMYAARASKMRLSALIAAASAVLFAGSLVFYEALYSPLCNKYDVYPMSGVYAIIPIIVGLAVYIVAALLNRKALQRNGGAA